MMIEWLLHTLVATSALILLVLAVREPVRKCFGSRVTYGLWLIPAARLFMPTLTHTVERIVPAASLIRPPVPEPLAMAHVAARAPSFLDPVGGWSTVAVSIWLGVAAALFLTRMIAFRRDRQAILAQSSARVTRLGLVRLVRSSEVFSPVAMGILRPIVAVPADFERMYAKRERRLVLEHELAHHRSGDLVTNLFAFVLLCLQWFNPLAWVAHTAFRFDQEAACDARVLDKAPAADRGSYGRAIAKAASGRMLLFASALDRPTSLQRRLQSLLNSSNPARRIAGRVLIVVAVAAALPLTAGRAIAYVDVPMPAAPAAALPAVVPAAAVVAVTASQPAPAPPTEVHRAAPAAPAVGGTLSELDGDMTINDDFVTIDGRRKRWEDLTPVEFARVKAGVAKARAALANTHIDQAKLLRDLANLPDQARLQQLQRGLLEAQAKANDSLRRTSEAHSAVQSDDLEAAINERLRSLRDIDLQALSKALASVDRRKVAADVAGAAQSMERARIQLERIQARIDADPRK